MERERESFLVVRLKGEHEENKSGNSVNMGSPGLKFLIYCILVGIPMVYSSLGRHGRF